jgi:hypothetical protein
VNAARTLASLPAYEQQYDPDRRSQSIQSHMSSTRVFKLSHLLFGLLAVLLWELIATVMPRIYAVLHVPDRPSLWPMSIFDYTLPYYRNSSNWVQAVAQTAILCVVTLVVFHLVLRRISRFEMGVVGAIVAALALILLTNSYRGIQAGYADPISAGSKQYYHDAIEIGDPVVFIRHFEDIQSSLHVHSRTHPPGAVLVYYALHQLTGNTALEAVLLAAIATLGTGIGLILFLRATAFASDPDDPLLVYCVFLFLLMPSVQIYYISSLDALIAAAFILALGLYLWGKTLAAFLGAALAVFVASFLSFGFTFLLPVLAGIVWWQREKWKAFAVVIIALVVAYLLLFLALDFNYLHSFRLASRLENPDGFRLIADPGYYIMTRLEDVAEIILFFGPFLTMLLFSGCADARRESQQGSYVVLLGVGTLLAMFGTGAFGTGETARATSFIYPYLFLPVCWYLLKRKTTTGDRMQIAYLVFLQAVVMQVVGWYFW